jgi:hypothetical protein
MRYKYRIHELDPREERAGRDFDVPHTPTEGRLR